MQSINTFAPKQSTMRLLCTLCLLSLLKTTAAAQCFQWINCDSKPVTFCDPSPNDTALWNAQYWKDNLLNSNDLYEGNADLNISVKNLCGKGSALKVRYLLYLDLNADGNAETVVDSDRPAQSDTLFYGNAKSPNFVGGEPRRFDFRQLPANERYRFALERKADGQNLSVALRWTTAAKPQEFVAPQLPGRGKHFIIWIVSDALGKLTCVQNFEVRDCKGPELLCPSNLSANIMPTKNFFLNVFDILKNISDNTCPSALIEVGIGKADSSSTFPYDSSGNPIQVIEYQCHELGLNTYRLWAKDKEGNISSCTETIAFQDPFKNCDKKIFTYKVCFGPYGGKQAFKLKGGIEATTGSMNPLLNTVVSERDSFGCHTIKTSNKIVPLVIAPELDKHHLNGVSTFDALRIAKHILGLAPLGSPYQIIAADVNQSNSLTTMDIGELQKLITKLYTAFPNNSSWRFVTKDFVFQDNSNPFASIFPTSHLFKDTLPNQEISFLPIKVGDVNYSAITDSSSLVPTEPLGPILEAILPDTALKAGTVVEIPLYLGEKGKWEGIQFDLMFDANVIEMEQVKPNFFQNSYYNFITMPGTLILSGLRLSPKELPENQAALFLRIRVLKDAMLKDIVAFNPNHIRAEAYDEKETIRPLQLQFEKMLLGSEHNLSYAQPPVWGTVSTTDADEANFIGEPWPNPVSGNFFVEIGPDLVDKALLEISDLNGRILYSGLLPNTLTSLSDNILPNTGVYFWRVTHNTGSKSGKLIKH